MAVDYGSLKIAIRETVQEDGQHRLNGVGRTAAGYDLLSKECRLWEDLKKMKSLRKRKQ